MTLAASVAVSGIGMCCAAGIGLEAVLEALFGTPRPPRPPRRFDSQLETPLPVFEVQWNVLERFAREDVFSIPSLAFLLDSARQALAQAGWTEETLREARVGTCIGTSVGTQADYFSAYCAVRRGVPPDAQTARLLRDSNPALALSRRFVLTGPCQCVSTACASGTDAIGIGAGWIAQGLCDVVLAGGAEALGPIPYHGFARLMITDSAPCKPFDARRNGLNLGEGAAVMILEPMSRLAARKAAAMGHVLGYGTMSDAHHPTAPHPEGRGLEQALRQALHQSEATSGDIAFVNVHGTGTRENDRVESQVLGRMLPGVPVSATKGATGHALGAAGAIEAAITLGCLNRGMIPASAGFSQPDPELGLRPVSEPTPIQGRIAVSQSLAFGGCNSALVLAGGSS